MGNNNDGMKVLPLHRDFGAKVAGVAPATIEFTSSRKKADGAVEFRCSKCGLYFSDDNPHTEDTCNLSQLMND